MVVEVAAALQFLVLRLRLLDEMRVVVEAGAEVLGPLWKLLSAKVLVSFRDSTYS